MPTLTLCPQPSQASTRPLLNAFVIQEVQYSLAEEEGNDNNDIDDGEAEDVSSDTIEKPYSDITPASQQLITEF